MNPKQTMFALVCALVALMADDRRRISFELKSLPIIARALVMVVVEVFIAFAFMHSIGLWDELMASLRICVP